MQHSSRSAARGWRVAISPDPDCEPREDACRVIKTRAASVLRTVARVLDAMRMRAMHDGRRGPAHRAARSESYLGIEKIIAAAKQTVRAGDPSGLRVPVRERKRSATRAWPTASVHRPRRSRRSVAMGSRAPRSS